MKTFLKDIESKFFKEVELTTTRYFARFGFGKNIIEAKKIYDEGRYFVFLNNIIESGTQLYYPSFYRKLTNKRVIKFKDSEWLCSDSGKLEKQL